MKTYCADCGKAPCQCGANADPAIAAEQAAQAFRTADATARRWLEMVSDAAAADVTETDEQTGLLGQVMRDRVRASLAECCSRTLTNKLQEAERDAAALRECMETMVSAMSATDAAIRERMLRAALPRARELVGGAKPAWKPSPYRFVRVAGPESPVPGAKVYHNDDYVANVYPERDGFVHISFSRIDGGAAVDWRDKQHMKNQLVGAKNEGVELFPAECRKVDGANQFHLFVMADPNARFSFGYVDRMVSDASDIPGVRQRPGSGATHEDEAKVAQIESAYMASSEGQTFKGFVERSH